VHRRAYTLLIVNAVVMGSLAIIVSLSVGRRLVDPDGSFLGPSWFRLPLLVVGAFSIDMLPRILWASRGNPISWKRVFAERWRQHWTRERVTLVLVGLLSFYVVYVSYRNLKSMLPFVRSTKYDHQLHHLDSILFFGNEPAILLHHVLGEGFSAQVLSTVYLWFLPLVPVTVVIWIIWSRNISYGYWFVTSQCLAWTLGTASYYALPTLGPGFEYSYLYTGLSGSGSEALMTGLSYGRQAVTAYGIEGAVQSVAGFASLHCAITMLFALTIQHTFRSRVLHWVFWVNFAITGVATLYFGWHYFADDVAGMAIALISFYVGGVASGQRFDRLSLVSHPTTATSSVPVEEARITSL